MRCGRYKNPSFSEQFTTIILFNSHKNSLWWAEQVVPHFTDDVTEAMVTSPRSLVRVRTAGGVPGLRSGWEAARGI